jgi:Ser/Thr protein kinase RdoA (MazF antagonist)
MTPEATPERIAMPAETILYEVARRALPAFGLASAELAPLAQRENAVYRVQHPDTGALFVLHVHRPGYHSEAALRSELQWTEALRLDGVDTPRAVATTRGDPIHSVDIGPPWQKIHCHLTEWIEGAPPDPQEIVAAYRLLGEIDARIHRHARTWQRPAGFVRHAWDLDGLLGEQPLWGRFDTLPLLTAPQLALLTEARDAARERIGALGRAADGYGLIHADLMPENILVHGSRVSVIDFDDGGFGWNVYDLATSLILHIGQPYYAGIRDAWLEGYHRVDSLPASQLSELSAFLVARALIMLGWIGTRPETETARALGPLAVDMACGIAGDFLRQG